MSIPNKMEEKKEKKEKLKTISPMVSKLIIRNLGIYASERLSVDIYYLMEVVNLLVAEVGEDWLEKKYKEKGKSWSDVNQELIKLNSNMRKMKDFYDAIQDKKFEKKKVSEVQGYFLKNFKSDKKIALLQPTLHELFILIVKNTNLQRLKIPSEAFKVPEHVGFKKIKLPERTTEIRDESKTSEAIVGGN